MATIYGTSGNDPYNGTSGVIDTAVIGSSLAQSSFAFNGQNWVVTSTAGTDVLTSIESVQLNDAQIGLSVGGEIGVNTYTAYDQTAPAITALSDGGYVVTWQSGFQDASGTGIYSQRYDSSGAKVGSETLVNTYTTSDQSAPAITALSGGGYVVTWQSSGQDASGVGIYSQRYDSAGAKVGSETLVNTYTSSDQMAPAITALSDGGYVVSWASSGQDASGYGIYTQRYDSSGAKVGGETLVNTYTTSDQSAPAITALSNGGYVVTWESTQDTSGIGIYSQRYDSAGAKVGSETLVNTYTTSTQSAPAIAALSDGGYVVTWQSYNQDAYDYSNGIYSQRYDSTGAKVGGETLVNTYTPSEQSASAITALNDGGYVVAWQSYGPDASTWGICTQRYDSNGIKVGGETLVNTYTGSDQMAPAITALSDGGYIVSWNSYNQDAIGGNGIYTQRYDSAGLPSLPQLLGTASGDVLNAMSGPSIKLAGAAGNDSLNGGSGNDILDGGVGNDSLTGGAGNDTYIVDSSADAVIETSTLASEIDTVRSGFTYVLGANLENLNLTGAAAINGTGNSLNNNITGNGAANLLDGGLGNDTLVGGLGNDTYIVDSVNDVVLEGGGALAGVDTVMAGFAYALGANLENLTLTGTQAINGTGNSLNNKLTGNGAANVLDGGLGNDTLTGGLGNDTYVVDSASDVVTESSGLVTEIDTVQSAVTYTLGSNLENLTLTGAVAINGTGNALNNVIVGNSANNALSGAGGDDTLDGGAGDDTLTGGVGNDTYLVDSAADVVVETSITGTDVVLASTTYTLASNLESLILTGNASINGTGNGLNNAITGNAASNTLDGGAGIDTLTGGAGDDIYIVDSTDSIVELVGGGTDTVQVAASYTIVSRYVENAVLTGSAAANLVGNLQGNVLTGNSADNTLNGGRGADTMFGGAGSDTYIVDDVGDSVSEALNAGLDTVVSQVNFTLGDNVENLSLVGNLSVSGWGNGLDNLMLGNVANNQLTAGAGADTLIGGGGDDVYVVDAQDQVIESALEGVDRVEAFASWVLGDNLENLTLRDGGNYNGTGNDADNVIFGNAGNNILDGKSGADTLDGGAGSDIYLVDNIGDAVTDSGYGADVDLVKASVTAVLGYGIENLTLLGTLAINGTGNGEDNIIRGNTGNNILAGGYGFDTLYGGDGDDGLTSTDGFDSLIGGLGNDTYSVMYDSDDIVEAIGQGTDTVVAEVSYAYTLGANLEKLILVGGNIDGHGNILNNDITGTDGANVLDGGAGADVLRGKLGNDTYLVDNAGDQVLEAANEGIDEVFSSISLVLASNVENLTLTGGGVLNGTGNVLNNRLVGNLSANSLGGMDGNDVLVGGGGQDSLAGDLGNDTLNGGVGNDLLDGGDGIDLATYFTLAGGVSVSLANASAQNTGSGGTDTLVGIENLDGSNAGNDSLSGSVADNRINGYGGNDTITGGAGNDALFGGEGNDSFIADAGDDRIDGGNGADQVSYFSVTNGVSINLNLLTAQNVGLAGFDTLINIENLEGSNAGNDNLIGDRDNNVLAGFGGNDLLSGGAGNDTLDGGAGTDTADFSKASEGVTADISSGVVSNDGFGSVDSLIAIENLVGGAFDDLLVGNALANVLTGGVGRDTLVGNAGNDIFDFNTFAEMGKSSTTCDVISDFKTGDKIDLSTLDANTTTTANDAFSATLVSAFTAPGQLKFAGGVLYGNTDANLTTVEFAIALTGVSTLVASDIVL